MSGLLVIITHMQKSNLQSAPAIPPSRLEAFSDGVMAIIITIIVLEIKIPEKPTLEALKPVLPLFLAYALSFRQIGTYWNNHHHLLQLVNKVTPKIMWANLNFLFFVSLTPFITLWLGENYTAALPTALFGINSLASGLAYRSLQKSVLEGHDQATIANAGLASDFKGIISLLSYALAIPLAFVEHWLSIALYVLVAVMWFIPDRRVEKVLIAEN